MTREEAIKELDEKLEQPEFTPEELFEGDQPVERWGLRRPVVSELASRLGVSAATCEEFCEEVRKGGAAL